MKITVTESECDCLGPEISCRVRRLLEVWDGIGQLVDEIYLNLPEETDGDPRKERFQVSVGTSEPKPAEIRKCDARRDRPIHQRDMKTDWLET